MADQTGIEWTDATWNPTTGCDKVSAGCDNCYALTLAGRLKAMGSAHYQTDGDPRTSGPGFGVAVHPDALTLPLRWRRPRLVFVNSMSDLFHPRVPDEFIARVFAVMAATPQHTYQILTKRPARMRSFLRDECKCHPAGAHLLSAMSWAATQHNPEHVPGLTIAAVAAGSRGYTFGRPLQNVWLGVSVENQEQADRRIPALLDTPAAVRWVSAEPLLGPVDLGIGDPHRGHESDDVHGHPHPRICLTCSPDEDHEVVFFRREPGGHGIDWVVAGGESGARARPMHPDWPRSLRDQCVQAGVPFLFKQHGAWTAVDDSGPEGWRARRGTDWEVRRDGYAWPLAQPHGAEDGTEATVRRVGKHAAGRVLDGRTWDQYPDDTKVSAAA